MLDLPEMDFSIKSIISKLIGSQLASQSFGILKIWQWVGFILVLFISLVLSVILARLLISTLNVIIKRQDQVLNENDYDTDLLIKPAHFLFLGWIGLIGLYPLQLSSQFMSTLVVVAKVLSYYGMVMLGWHGTNIFQRYLENMAQKTSNKFDDLLAPLISRTIKITVLIVGGFSIAEILKLPISSLLAGLGIGGIAIAMAAKDTIANIFGSLTVLVDRPFSIGDWVVIGDVEGTVEHLGFRSTRVRTFYNSLVTIPNAELLTAKIDNMGERSYRRIRTMLSLTYDTPPEKIEAFCEGVRDLIKKHPLTRKDYYHVYFNAFNESSLDILLYCFLKTPDWAEELKGKHDLFLSIISLAKKLNVEFAFPTRTLFLNKDLSV